MFASILKFDPYHEPAGSSVGGRFAKASGIEGLPKDVSINSLSLTQVREALARGVFKITAKEHTGEFFHPGDQYDLSVLPNDIPKDWKQAPDRYSPGDGQWYDPKYAQVDPETKRVKPIDPLIWETSPDGREDGFIFRGMSYEEYQKSMKQGHFESRGDYNLGDEQVGLTYYSKDKSQASAYASGFAPWQYAPTPSRPGVMVKIKDPGNHVTVAGTGEDEVGIRGKVGIDQIADVYFAHPISFSAGDQEIRNDRYSGNKDYTAGSSSGYSPSVRWDHEDVNVKKQESLAMGTDFSTILKFNPNHDATGRFSTSNASASVQSTAPVGIQFVSPNVREGTDVNYAVGRSGGTLQRRFRKDFQAVDNLLGTQGAQEDAIGAWSDGGENSVAQFSANDLPLEKLNVSAAMKGYLAEQKAVVSFKTGKGNQKMHTFDASISDPVLLSKELVEQGLPFHTLLPHAGKEGFQVIVFSDNASSKEGKALSLNVTKAAKSFGSKHTFMKGSGGFIGSWDTREAGRTEYNKVIDPYIAKHPELKAGWDAMVKKMKHRVTKFINILFKKAFTGVSYA